MWPWTDIARRTHLAAVLRWVPSSLASAPRPMSDHSVISPSAPRTRALHALPRLTPPAPWHAAEVDGSCASNCLPIPRTQPEHLLPPLKFPEIPNVVAVAQSAREPRPRRKEQREPQLIRANNASTSPNLRPITVRLTLLRLIHDRRFSPQLLKSTSRSHATPSLSSNDPPT